jgi:tetratricopeptide (TPR) repeat protein
MAHLGKSELGDFLTGRLDAAGRQRALDHLHSGCILCQQHLRALAELLLGEEPWLAAEPVAEEQYEEAFAQAGVVARSFRIRWRKEMGKLERALTLLDQAPGGLGDESFPWRQAQALHGWPLCEALLQKSYEARFSDPKRMLNLAESAVGVAKHIKPEKYPWPGFVADLRARAFAELSNAYRVNNRLSDAEIALGRAKEFLEEGTEDYALEAQVFDFEASLRSSQRRLKDAVTLLGQVYRLHMEAGDFHLAGRALIAKGSNALYQGYARESVDLIQRGLEMLDVRRDPFLALLGRLNKIDSLIRAGEPHRAGLELLQGGQPSGTKMTARMAFRASGSQGWRSGKDDERPGTQKTAIFLSWPSGKPKNPPGFKKFRPGGDWRARKDKKRGILASAAAGAGRAI